MAPLADGKPKLLLLHALAVSTACAVTAAAVRYHRRRMQPQLAPVRDLMLAPTLELTDSGRVADLERFSHYVARQMGFEDINECPQLCKLAYDYLKRTKGSEDDIYSFFANERDPDSLYVKLVEELETCILSYFAFHWNHATLVVTQILSAYNGEPKKKLKNFVMEATRKLRFERVSKSLKVTRVFSTLVEEMKAIGYDDDCCNDTMVPAALSDRSPVLLLMGGGMGAGKSTVLKDIQKEAFWLAAKANAVVVEADAFKETDVIYRALSSRGHHNDMLQTAELVHQSSTDAASSLLVTALNEGRDVIMDGTLSWEPFVEQTIAMARNVHLQRYRMGVGYKVAEDGTITENYWEPVEDDEENCTARKPYRIELVGVVCDAYLAVVRGIRRAIIMGRAVRVQSQLKSHQRFANAFPKYCQLVDNARLYSTNAIGSPKLIGWKDGSSNLLVDRHHISCLEDVSNLNDNADSIYELYPKKDACCGAGLVWGDMVLSPTRASIQEELKATIKAIESRAL
ncbi:calmodulin calcium-dependent NAD kinase-like isoform X1 [Zingiber officinale]|uniref:calmodulin calcium-dependent NAD kinase-like isoform X1 n=2 Tax=Zingiber officinale TaxID=94328 RepID=UPI001C4D347D|nr:calmodulin calcium-dependent NAD kinase-like isoform X1 [Zingiber officinale]